MQKIIRLELNDGSIYEFGEPWPGTKETDQAKVRRVGHIFFRSENGTTFAADDDGDMQSSNPDVFYEVWSMAPGLYSLMSRLMAGEQPTREMYETAYASGIVIQRRIEVSAVKHSDKAWDVAPAMEKITERVQELKDEEDEGGDDGKEEGATTNAASGNGTAAATAG